MNYPSQSDFIKVYASDLNWMNLFDLLPELFAVRFTVIVLHMLWCLRRLACVRDKSSFHKSPSQALAIFEFWIFE